MPVDSTHRLYDKRREEWMLCRAVCAGASQVKSDGVRELVFPRLSGQSEDADYLAYVDGAYFFPAASRARNLFRGLMHRLPSKVDAPDDAKAKAFLADVTGSDVPLSAEEFRQLADDECLTSGWGGVLTDMPRVGGPEDEGGIVGELTKGQSERLGVRPTWTLYEADDVLNWGYVRHGGRTMLGLVVLHEWRTLRGGDDEFARPRVEQWRVLDLYPPPPALRDLLPSTSRPEAGGSGLAYRVRLFRLKEEQSANDPDPFEVVSTAFPRRQSELMAEIQYDPFGAEGNTMRPPKPPLSDVVDVNVAHARNSASREHALLWVGNPQPVIFGYDPEVEEDGDDGTEPEATAETTRASLMRRLALEAPATTREWRFGAPEILLIRNENASAHMFSVKSEDVAALKEAADDKKAEMVQLVGRMLAAESQANIAERTEELQRSADQGVLANIQVNVSKAMTRALKRALDWMGIAGECSITSPVDYFQRMLSPAEALAIAEMALKLHIAESDVRDLLRRGGWIRPDRTDEQIEAELALQPPPLADLVPPTDAPPDGGDPPAPPPPPTRGRGQTGNPQPEPREGSTRGGAGASGG